MTFERRGLGHVPDRDKLPGESPDHVYAFKATPVPNEVDLRHLIVDVLDQQQLGSCSANAVQQAIRMLRVKRGEKKPELGSRLFAYYLARKQQGDQNDDTGCALRDVLDGLRRHGLPPEHVWPYSDKNSGSPDDPFRRTPPAEVLQAAFDLRPSYQRVKVAGLTSAVVQALALEEPVVFGTLVSNAMCAGEIDTSVPLDAPALEDVAGSHALIFVGFRKTKTRIDLLVCNSWGTDWGDGGYFWMSESFADTCRDVWALTGLGGGA